MKKTVITKEQSERVNNRLILNFGILLAGALILLYVYNFAQAGYPVQVKNVLGILGIVSLVVAVLMLVLGFKKWPKLKIYSTIPFAVIIPCALISYFHKIPFLTNAFPGFTIQNAIVVSLILMAVYFVVLAVYTGIYSATHTVVVEKKKIQHKKKK